MTVDEVHPVLAKLVRALQSALPEGLMSVVLYGSAARGEYEKSTSDLNVLIVVAELSPSVLEDLSKPIKQWERSGQPQPRLLSQAIIRESADVFPIEFLDLKATHRILHGYDPLENLEIDLDHLRIQCERELREKMMRLREGYIEVHSSTRKLKQLLTDSYSTFAALFRGCLYLHGDEIPAYNDEVVAVFAATAGIDATPFEDVSRLKHGKAITQQPKELFARYYDELMKAVSRVDRFIPSSGGKGEH